MTPNLYDMINVRNVYYVSLNRHYSYFKSVKVKYNRNYIIVMVGIIIIKGRILK